MATTLVSVVRKIVQRYAEYLAFYRSLPGYQSLRQVLFPMNEGSQLEVINLLDGTEGRWEDSTKLWFSVLMIVSKSFL